MTEVFSAEFIQAMDAIITEVNFQPNGILKAMEQCKEDEREKEYLTFDCALAYLTYKSIINPDKQLPELEEYIPKLIARIQANLEKMK